MATPKYQTGKLKNGLSTPLSLQSTKISFRGIAGRGNKFKSILGKEISAQVAAENKIKKQNEKKATDLWQKRFEEAKQVTAKQEKDKNLIKRALKQLQNIDPTDPNSAELTEAALSKLVNRVSDKFDEYIIDEDEIFDILSAVDVILNQKGLHLDDKIDIWYKYAKLYFKHSNKQESIGSHEQERSADK